VSRLKRLHAQFHLVVAFILFLLVADVRSDHRFIKSYCRDKVSACPKHFTREVPRSTAKSTCEEAARHA
jgi:hypothetical protein